MKIFRHRDIVTLLAMAPFTLLVAVLDEAGNWSEGMVLLVLTMGMLVIGGIGFHTNWPHRHRS